MTQVWQPRLRALTLTPAVTTLGRALSGGGPKVGKLYLRAATKSQVGIRFYYLKVVILGSSTRQPSIRRVICALRSHVGP
jgi:hypothetical protein